MSRTSIAVTRMLRHALFFCLVLAGAAYTVPQGRWHGRVPPRVMQGTAAAASVHSLEQTVPTFDLAVHRSTFDAARPRRFKKRSILSQRACRAILGCAILGPYCGPALKAYEAQALSRPLATKALTSGAAFFFGDMLAQRLAKDGVRDRARCVRSGLAGLLAHGVPLHYWCGRLDALLGPAATPRIVIAKILLDQLIFSAYLNVAYAALLEMMQGRAPGPRVSRVFWPSLKRAWMFWPQVHCLTYSIVPNHLRVLWIGAVEIVWVSLLSAVNHKQKDKADVRAHPKEDSFITVLHDGPDRRVEPIIVPPATLAFGGVDAIMAGGLDAVDLVAERATAAAAR